MNITDTMEFINSFSKSGKPVTDLSRARGLMERIGNPENKLRFIHVAGTNGKGSVVEYISNALILSGYRVGQFTSPFVLHYADRIRINGSEIDEGSLCELAEEVRKAVSGDEYSQFEVTMAIALLWYVREKCDIVVLEAGIGGLLDCTNVIPPPLVAVISSISLDHTAILGDSVEKIARQKAGIIKEGSAVVVDHTNPNSVLKIISDTANSKNAAFIKAEHTEFRLGSMEYDGQPFIYRGVDHKTAMFGYAQPVNAVTAITACEYLCGKGFAISDENIKKAVETTRIKARMQYIDAVPPVIVDGGHNPSGVDNLVSVLNDISRPVYAVLGMVDSKDYSDGAKKVSRSADMVFTTDDFAPNAVIAEILAEAASKAGNGEACSSLAEAVEKARALALQSNGIMVVCGSLYLASKYLNEFQKTN